MAMMKIIAMKAEELINLMVNSYDNHILDWEENFPSDETVITTVSGIELRVMFPWLYEELVSNGDTKYWYLDSWTATETDVEAVAHSFNPEAQYEVITQTIGECGSEYYSWGFRRIS